MNFVIGDIVSGGNVAAGTITGIEIKQMMGVEASYYIIKEDEMELVHFYPVSQSNNLRKVPSVEMIKKHFQVFESDALIDVDKKDGSRYKFFQERVKSGDFQALVEVVHDLILLQKESKLSVGEKMLYKKLKEKLVKEISCVLESSDSMLEKLKAS